MNHFIRIDVTAKTQRGKRRASLPAVMTDDEMTRAVNGVLATLNLSRDNFFDQRNSAILISLSERFNMQGSIAANIVLAQAGDAARQLEGKVRKICCRTDFFISCPHRPGAGGVAQRLIGAAPGEPST